MDKILTRSKRKADDKLFQIPNYSFESHVVGRQQKVSRLNSNISGKIENTNYDSIKRNLLELIFDGDDFIEVNHELKNRRIITNFTTGLLENVIYRFDENGEKIPFLEAVAKKANLVNSRFRPSFRDILPKLSIEWNGVLKDVTHVRIETFVTTHTQGLYRLTFYKPYEFPSDEYTMWPRALNVFHIRNPTLKKYFNLSDNELKNRVSRCRQVYYQPSSLSQSGEIFIQNLPICYLAYLPTDDMGFNISLTWDPSYRKIRDLPSDWILKNSSESKTYITFHSYGYSGFFRPSISEVMSQLPSDLFKDQSNRWLIRTEPISHETNKCRLDNNLYVAITIVYPDKED